MKHRKRLNIFTALLLAASLVGTAVPADAAAERAGIGMEAAGRTETGTDSDTAGRTGTGTDMGSETASGGAEYAEGEAIILYETNASSASAQASSGILGADMQIERTCEFEDAQDAPAKSSRNAKTQEQENRTLKVSLVTSDRYSTQELVKQLQGRRGVLAAEPNYRIHALDLGQDAYAKYQWAIENRGQNHGTAGMDVKPVQKALEAAPGGKECVIALVDTGMDYTNEELRDVVWDNPFQPSKLRGSHGYDIVNKDADPMDDNGHGTHCAGIMAAQHNQIGIRGVVNRPEIKIMPLKILDEIGVSYEMESVEAYHYIYKAQQLGVNVVAINNSWGGLNEEESVILPKLIELVGEKGALSICAAGNESVDNDKEQTLPASIDSPYVISVAAANENDELAEFSNYGKESADLAAPGADILSTVSYYCFNPGIYENPNELCSVYEDFTEAVLADADTAGEGEFADGFAKTSGKAEQSLALTDEAYFGLEGDREKSLKWSIRDAREGESYCLYFPYTAQESATDLYDSIMVKAVAGVGNENGGEEPSIVFVNDYDLEELEALDVDKMDTMAGMVDAIAVDKGNYWNHMKGVSVIAHSGTQNRILAISLGVARDGDYEIYLDNLGISKPDISQEAFGTYDYYNGTSMAAPYVTGAAAALACAFPDEDTLDLRKHIFRCTRKSESLEGKLATGGTLDLSRAGEANFYIKDISLTDGKDIRIEGRCLREAAVTVNGSPVTPREQSEDEIILDSNAFLNRSLEFAVSRGGEVLRRTCFFPGGDGFAGVGILGRDATQAQAVSDGERIYHIEEDGYVFLSTPDQKDEEGDILWMDGGGGYSVELFGMDAELMTDYTIRRISDFACLDNRIFTILKLDMGFSEECLLACYDDEQGWKTAYALPGAFENAAGVSLAAYQGELYLCGGFDEAAGKAQTAVMRMDPLTREWNACAPLPEARAFAKAVTVGRELVLTLGKNDADTLPKNLVFDGESWKISQAVLNAGETGGSYTYRDGDAKEQTVPYYSAWTGAVKGGVAYAGLAAEGLGDTFFYDLASDRYEAADYAVSNTAREGLAQKRAVVLRDKMYLLAQEESNTHVYAMPVEDTSIAVTVPDMEEYAERGMLKGIRHYMPGDAICIAAEAYEGYFVKQLTVDGRKIAKDAEGRYQYRTVADAAKRKITASALFGAYVAELYMDDETVELYPGQMYPLNVNIYPENADNPKIIWTSSKPDLVSIETKSGNLRVSSKAKRGNTAVITATAADRKKVSASFKVKIVSRPLPMKNEVFPSGKLKYKVTASSSKKKTVACSGFADKAAQKVKIPDTIRINGYTFKVTGIAGNAFAKNKKIKSAEIGKNVTSIGKKAFSGCSSLKSVKIAGSAVKTIGKQAFHGIHKKAVIRVPAKKKKSYLSKLRKSGYSGKVKG